MSPELASGLAYSTLGGHVCARLVAEAAETYIEEMLGTSPLGLRLTKECLNMSVDAGSLEAAVAMEDRNQILAAQTADCGEGIRAFLEKRRPVYADR